MHDGVTTDIQTQKPEIIANCNSNKGGVGDNLDEKFAEHSSSRCTRGWPLVVFQNSILFSS